MSDEPLNWRLHWTGTRNVWAIAGCYRTRSEAENGITQLKRLAPAAEFRIEYIGKGISHHNDGSKTHIKY
jgi:uncharacterized protein YegP (UPF0339 family)